MHFRRLCAIASIALLTAAAAQAADDAPPPPQPDAALVARGAYLAKAGDCEPATPRRTVRPFQGAPP